MTLIWIQFACLIILINYVWPQSAQYLPFKNINEMSLEYFPTDNHISIFSQKANVSIYYLLAVYLIRGWEELCTKIFLEDPHLQKIILQFLQIFLHAIWKFNHNCRNNRLRQQWSVANIFPRRYVCLSMYTTHVCLL